LVTPIYEAMALELDVVGRGDRLWDDDGRRGDDALWHRLS